MASSATLQTPHSPQILQLPACLLAYFYSAPLVEFYSALDTWHFDEIQAVMRVKAEAKAAHIEKRNAALKSAESPESREPI